MADDKYKGPYILSLLRSIGIVGVSLIMAWTVGFGNGPPAEEDTRSWMYRHYGPNGLKFSLLFMALALFLFGVWRLIRSVRALRSIK